MAFFFSLSINIMGFLLLTSNDIMGFFFFSLQWHYDFLLLTFNKHPGFCLLTSTDIMSFFSFSPQYMFHLYATAFFQLKWKTEISICGGSMY
jgi:hypothetical protein